MSILCDVQRPRCTLPPFGSTRRDGNLIGKLEFTAEAPRIDINELAARYAERRYKAFEEGEDGSLA